jgi:hypothetical protein
MPSHEAQDHFGKTSFFPFCGLFGLASRKDRRA